MRMLLHKLTIENFKGLKQFTFEPAGQSAVIMAENGVGKTSVYDAFLWLLFGKDSTGRTAFEVRPLDRHNQPIKGLDVTVEADIEIDGNIHLFKRQQKEKVIKDQLRGYETFCWIDEVPKRLGEYQDFITDIVPEETFKLLTDLNYFNGKMHWTARRKILLDIAGQISEPAGFENLIVALKGRKIQEYKAVLSEQKKRYEKERGEINPRIDEILKGIAIPAGIDVTQLQSQRTVLQLQFEGLDKKRQELFDIEQKRHKRQERFNTLKGEIIKREAELKFDTSGIQKLLDEKILAQKILAEQRQKVSDRIITNNEDNRALTAIKHELENVMANLNNARTELKQAEAATLLTKCFACGQKLPASKIADNETKRNTSIKEKENVCKILQQKVELSKTEIDKIKTEIKKNTDKLEFAKAELKQAEEAVAVRLTEIDKQIINRPTPPPEQDKAWQKLTKDIKKAESELGQPLSEQLNEIETQREILQNQLNGLNDILAQADRLERDKVRVQELETKEKELAQKITEIDGQISEIKRYTAAQSEKISEAVNGRFKYIRFKMFDQNLNGEYIDCCDATFKGVPYSDLSTGQQILCGIDIINVLAEHNVVNVPLFIDHLEALTYTVEANSQIIGLKAVEGMKELTVKTA